MRYKHDNYLKLYKIMKWRRLFFLFIPLVLFAGVAASTFAQDDSQRLTMEYQNDLLTITAKNVDIKKIFTELAEKADIYIEYPSDMEKNITLSREGVSLDVFLSSLLRNMNYALFFSAESEKNSKISELYVYPDSKISSLSSSAQNRIASRIASYKRAVERIKEKLEKVGENSSRGKIYLRQIDRYEKKIEDLEGQL